MSTTASVTVVRRPLSNDMFADITTAAATFTPTSDGGATATFADDASALTSDQVQQVRIRMMTADDAEEQLFLQAWKALTTNNDFRAIASPTNAQVIAEVQALAAQMNGVIKHLLNLS